MSLSSFVLTALVTLTAQQPRPPFGVGERFEYSAKMGFLSLGSASIEVAGLDTVRGQPAWYFKFGLTGGNALFRIESSLESWTSARSFQSLRFRRDSKENGKRYLRDYAIFADSGYYRQSHATATAPTSAEPLDDASILYYVRIAPLTVGQNLRLTRHFQPENNPIVINVVKRETIEMPDGAKVNALVLNPVVGESGLFGRRAEARLWVTDDARRIPVQIRTRQPWGTITLRLQKMTAGATAPANDF